MLEKPKNPPSRPEVAMVNLPRLTPETLDFVLLSFEGPDQYAMAGGLGVRMKELSLELARQGFRTHLVFIGDPQLPAQESPVENLTLHRWSQWLSAHYPAGVYQGEEAKLVDWNEQLPEFVTSQLVAPAAAEGRLTAILAEEWHTAYAICQTSDRLWSRGLRDKAVILWNANNVMGFDRIDWKRLDFCSQITTVSRYMKHVMWDRGVNPLVIPNGIPGDRIRDADPAQIARARAAFPGRELLFKIGRFSPDKRWNMAIDALAEEKRRGHNVAAVIRGGVEPHGMEVLANARAQGLVTADVQVPWDTAAALDALGAASPADVYNVTSFMSDELISVLYSAADGVLANSGHEPFGLVGLEVMAAAGVAFVGSTGEDYAVPFLNSVVLDTDDPAEINIALDFLRAHPQAVTRLRYEARETARSFSWENVVNETLLGKLDYVSRRQLVTPPTASVPSPPSGEQSAGGDASAPSTAVPLTTLSAPRMNDLSATAAYGGESTCGRLSVKPRIADDGEPEPSQTSD
jgi:glycosyltransferase involved in cell wall biosynthesis